LLLLTNIPLYQLILQVSNGIGAISGFVQLLLYGYYYFWGENKDVDANNNVPKPTLAEV
jgi:hypothetical protein